MRPKLFSLNNQQRKALRQRYRQEKDRRAADKIQCILLLDEGHNKQEVASILMVSPKTIKRWVKKFVAQGIEGLCRSTHRGRSTILTERETIQLQKWLDVQGICSAKEVQHYIEQTFNKTYSQSGVCKLLRRLNYSYKKPAVVPAKADPLKQADFVQEYLCYRHLMSSEDKVYFVDASHFLHNAIAGYGWSKRGQRVELKTNSGRNRFNVLGAYSPDDHTLIRVEGSGKCDARMVVKLLLQIRRENRRRREIILIMDNASYQHAWKVKKAAHRLGIRLLFLPPYSPNLNLIERLWKLTKAKVVRNKYYPTFAKFKESLRGFLDNLEEHKSELASLLTENFQLFSLDSLP